MPCPYTSKIEPHIVIRAWEGPMSHHSISRRRFTLGVMTIGGMMLATRRAFAADFDLRQFHNQPSDSPLHKRLVDMWAAVKDETHGLVQVQTFSDTNQI